MGWRLCIIFIQKKIKNKQLQTKVNTRSKEEHKKKDFILKGEGKKKA